MPILEKYPLHQKYLKSVARQRLLTTNPEDLSDDVDNDKMFKNIEKNNKQNSGNLNRLFTLNTAQNQSFQKNHKEQELPRDSNFIKEKFGVWYLADQNEIVDYFIITPFSNIFYIWSLIFMISLIYNILYVPFCIGLDYEIPLNYIIIDILVMIITLMDSILRPFLAVNNDHELQTDRRLILQNYFKTCFLLDLLSTFPFDYLFLLIDSYAIAKYFKLLRLLKLYRLLELSSIVRQHSELNVMIFRLMSLFFAFIMIAHWFNCTLLYFGRWELYQGRRFDGKTLLEYLTKNSSVKLPPPEHQTAWELYFNLMVLSVCFMGSVMYGDIIPFTISEETVSIIEMIIGRMFISFLFAEMSSYIQIQYQAYNDHIAERDIIIKWIDLNSLDLTLKTRVNNFFDYKWKYKKGVKEEDLIKDLPQSLRKDVLYFIFEDLIANCEVFPHNNPGAIRSITRRLKRIIIPKDEIVIRQGELASDMYFIMKGKVRVYQNKDGSEGTGDTFSQAIESIKKKLQPLAILEENNFFGEMALIHEAASIRSSSVIAITNVQLAVLTRQDFYLICESYPEFNTRMHEIATKRENETMSVTFGRHPTHRKNQLMNQESISTPGEQNQQSTVQNNTPTVKMQISKQLSLIEEESRVVEHISESSFKQKEVESAVSSSLEEGPQNQRTKEINDDNITPLFSKVNNKQDSSSSQEKYQAFENQQLEYVIDEDDEKNLEVESLTSEEKPTLQMNDQFSAYFQRPVTTNTQEQEESKSDEIIDFEDQVNSQSRASQNAANADQNMFEKSLEEENPFKLGMRNYGPGLSMVDIEKAPENREDSRPEQITRIDVTPRDFNMTQEFQSTHRSLANIQEACKEAKLQNNNKLSSSQSNFEDFRGSWKGNYESLKSLIHSMFMFFAFKYFLIFPLTLYNIIFIPIQMGFSTPFQGWFLFMEIITLILYSIDLYYISQNYRNHSKKSQVSDSEISHDKDQMEIKLKKIRLDLITSSLAIFPFSLIFQKCKRALFIVNLLRVLRLVKLLPGFRFLQALKRYNMNLTRLLEIIIAYYIVAHITAGVMLSIGLQNAPDISDTWLNKVPIPLPPDMALQNNSESVSQGTFYIHAIYFTSNTISHVAIGDLTSVTIEERMLNAFIIWMLTFFYSLLFANISSVFSTDNTFLQFNEKYQYVRNTLPLKKLNQKILNNIDNYFEYLWQTSSGNDEVSQIFRVLPPQLMYDAIRDRFVEGFEQSYLFSDDIFDFENTELNQQILNSFIELMKVRTYMPDDFLVKAGAHDENLYIVLEGDVAMIGFTNQILATMQPGSHFYTYPGKEDQNSDQNFHYGRSFVHLVCQSLTAVGIIEKAQLHILFQAFPEWRQLVVRMSYCTYQIGRKCLHRKLQGVGDMNQEEIYELERREIDDHITYSNEKIYQAVLEVFEDPKNSYLYNKKSKEYMHSSLKLKYYRILSEEGGDYNDDFQNDAPTKFQLNATRQNSRILLSRLSGIPRSLVLNSNLGWLSKILSNDIHFNRISPGRAIFDLFHLLNMIYIFYMIPFSIAFLESRHRLEFLILESLSTLFSLFVIFVNMRTPVFYKNGLTLKCKHVFSRYLLQGGLWIDVMAVIPLNLILGGIIQMKQYRVLQSMLRLSRLLSLLRLNQLMEKFQIYLKNHSIAIVSFQAVLFLTVLWHWTSCIWYFINLLEYDYYTITWIKKFDLIDKAVSEQYLYSMYYVIKIVTGVGQSDMIAYNNLERICFIIIINIGDALFAIAFGLISQLQFHISDNSSFQKYLVKLKQIDTFIQNVRAEAIQQRRVEQYYTYQTFLQSKNKSLETEDLKRHLPYSLVQDILFVTHKYILAKMFKQFNSENMLKDLSYMMKNQIYMPGDFIIVKDSVGEEMYFIKEGSVNVIGGDKNTILKTFYKGDFFGEIAIFIDIKRTAYIQACTPCVIGALMKADVREIMLKYPKLEAAFINEANKRRNEILSPEEIKQIHQQTANSISETSESISEEDELDGSFRHAFQQKIEQDMENQSFISGNTHKSLIKKIKKYNVANNGISDYFEKQNLRKKSSFSEGTDSKSSFKTLNQQQEPVLSTFGIKALENKKPFPKILKSNLQYTVPQPIVFHQFNTPIKEVIADEEDDTPQLQFNGQQQRKSKIEIDPVDESFESSDSEQKLSSSDEISSKYLQIPGQKADSGNDIPRISFKAASERPEEEQNTSSALITNSQPDEDRQLQTLKEINSDINDRQDLPLKIKKITMLKSKLNSTKDLPNINSFQLTENSKQRRVSLGHRNNSPNFRSQLSYHFTSPIQDQVKIKKLQKMSRKYSKMVFMKALDNDDPFTATESQQQSNNLNQKSPTNSPKPAAVARQVTTVRRQPKQKQPQRRLSKLQMGKNLMISNTAGFKLQWTLQGAAH